MTGTGRKLKFKLRHRLAGAGLVGLDRDLAAPHWRRNKQAPIITSAQRTPAFWRHHETTYSPRLCHLAVVWLPGGEVAKTDADGA